jgi:hypothetical protein
MANERASGRSKHLDLTTEQIDYLLSPRAIRERAQRIFELAANGKTHFSYHPERLEWTLEYVLRVIHKNYPELKIPFHSRWGHFRAGGVDRIANLDAQLGSLDAFERARTKLDLVVTSVLLDAGAGPGWNYVERGSGVQLNRSEGLGVASYHLFCAGRMSGDKSKHPLRADVAGLRGLTRTDIEEYFQVRADNPLVGVEGRLLLLNNLAHALENQVLFRDGRPGHLLDYLATKFGKKISAPGILRAVLDGFGSIWPGRISAGAINLGDVWTHPGLGAAGSYESLVPIHKLSQWLTYSMIEPIQEAGFEVDNIEGLTGLAEYRNGGLLLDAGLLQLRNPEHSRHAWAPESELIVEWRSLTVHLLDMIGIRVQKALGRSPAEFPLAKVLEGGTWWAGRFLARERRHGGEPPLNIQSDGTVF